MHPGQFTVLNSPRREVVENSVRELAYHTTFLDALEIDDTHKTVIHLGGIYGDKTESLKRFIQNAAELDDRIKARLVIENDEHCYTVTDTLSASKAIGVPVVFDVFHHRWNPALRSDSLRAIIKRSAATWRRRDGRVKIHYSNQWPGQPAGTHSKSISVEKFARFLSSDKRSRYRRHARSQGQGTLRLKNHEIAAHSSLGRPQAAYAQFSATLRTG